MLDVPPHSGRLKPIFCYMECMQIMLFFKVYLKNPSIHRCFKGFKDTEDFFCLLPAQKRLMPTVQRKKLKVLLATRTEEMWQQGAQTRWKQAMDREISGRPSITISNSWFNQSAVSSEARPACCAGARLSHQPPVPQETNTGEQQQMLPESTKRLGAAKVCGGKLLKRRHPRWGSPTPLTHPAGQVIALIKVKERPQAAAAEG